MATQRLTKKCFEVVDRTEIRKIAMKGMGLPAKKAYKLDNRGIIDWVIINSKEVDPKSLIVPFTEVNLAEIDALPGGSFRQGVLEYLLQLQGFILKKEDKPMWPGDIAEDEDTPDEVSGVVTDPSGKLVMPEGSDIPEEIVVEEIVVEEKKVAIKPKEYANAAKQAQKAKTEAKFLSKSKVGFTKAKIGKSVAAKTAISLDELARIETSVCKLSEEVTELGHGQMTQQENYYRLEKGLLYIINMLCEDGQEIACLDQVPKPEEYIT